MSLNHPKRSFEIQKSGYIVPYRGEMPFAMDGLRADRRPPDGSSSLNYGSIVMGSSDWNLAP